ncbi:MAG TPA: peptidoglycan-binding protein [Bacteroidetes bacterium]|nr:peptidoglycan-binding protein [Bacteroidota bacterium]
MKTIRKGSKGAQVTRWQFFLAGSGFPAIKADGDFGKRTRLATIEFQKQNGLKGDGVVGKKTYLAASHKGYNLKEARDWPPKPKFRPLSGTRARQAVFGKFAYKPVGPDSDNIKITDNWERHNIVAIEIPQLKSVRGARRDGKIRFHKKAAKQTLKLFQDWEDAGLKDRILTYAGSYVPRFIRGRYGVLSNHAFGSAFDINVAWNGLGREPALVGQKGSVRELVEIAHKNGFYWGGHFRRKDGMHFEVAKIKR